MPEALLAVRDIHTYYGDSYVLQGLSLELEAGRIVAILGRNGMGKSTLIRTVAGLLTVKAGSIRLSGENITELPAHRRAARTV